MRFSLHSDRSLSSLRSSRARTRPTHSRSRAPAPTSPSCGRSQPICCSVICSTVRWRRAGAARRTARSSSSRSRPRAPIPATTCKDASGRMWSVKLGVEAQSEVTASRILWAMGFPQPATYFVPQFTLTGADAGVKTNARFRTELEQWRSTGEWSWYDNPFVEHAAVSRPDRRADGAEQLGPEDHEQPHL